MMALQLLIKGYGNEINKQTIVSIALKDGAESPPPNKNEKITHPDIRCR